MGDYLTGDEILATRSTLKTEDVKAFGGVVRVRELTGTEVDEYQASLMTMTEDGPIPDMSNMRAKLVVRALIKEDGERMFTELQLGQLGQTSGVELGRVYEVASRLSGINASSDDEAIANLGVDLTGDSPSGSPES